MWQYVISLLFLSTFLFFNAVDAKEYDVEEYDENNYEDYADYYYDDEDQYEDDEDQYEDEEAAIPSIMGPPIGPPPFFPTPSYYPPVNPSPSSPTVPPVEVENPKVAFRLEDLQKLWIPGSPAFKAIIELFTGEYKMKLTGGIIAGHWYDEPSDPVMQGAVQTALGTGLFDVANQGMEITIISGSPAEQQSVITNVNNIIYNSLHVTPTVYFPPQDYYDDNTIQALHNLQFGCISSDHCTAPDLGQGLKCVKFDATTSYSGLIGTGLPASTVISEMEAQIRRDGYSIMIMHVLDYDDTSFSYTILREILDQVVVKKWDVVFVKEINP